jgi:hypothetical protein
VTEAVTPDRRLLVDPRFTGPFPLAGVHGQVVHLGPGPSGYVLQLHFVNLPTQRERELVRAVYEHQLQTLHEPPTHPGSAPANAKQTPAPAPPHPDGPMP